MRRRSLLISLIGIIVISFGSLGAALLTDTKPQLGLDLQGGASVTLQPVDPNFNNSAALDLMPEIFRRRIDSLGVAEPEVSRQGNTIVVNLPGVKNKDDAINQIKVPGKVVFRPVLQQINLLAQTGTYVSPCSNNTTPAPAVTPASGATPSTTAGTVDSTPTTIAGAANSTTAPASSGTVAATASAGSTQTAAPGATAASTGSSLPGPTREVHSQLPQQQTNTTAAAQANATTATTSGVQTTTATTAAGSTTAATASATTTSGTSPDTTPTTTTTTVPYTGPSTTVAPLPASQVLTPISTDTPDQTVILAENPNGDLKCAIVDQLGPAFALGEEAISGAQAVVVNGQWVVQLTLKEGAKGLDAWNVAAKECFGDGTTGQATCKERGMAIVLDHQVISAPVPNTPTFDQPDIQITGQFSEKRAKDLARILAYGATPVEMKVQTSQQVTATLGKNSLHAALVAGLIGIGFVMLFMLLYYKSLALIVLAGIVVSGALLWAVISVFSTQNGLRLSLSGITGIIVSVGVTVDSYVVFFEKLKDEVRGGKTLRSSAQRGFKGAWRTILAADVVSLIGALVLYQFSVGSVRGFAFFLGLSTTVDLVIAYFFTRPAVLLLAQSKRYRGGDVLGVHTGEAFAGGVS